MKNPPQGGLFIVHKFPRSLCVFAMGSSAEYRFRLEIIEQAVVIDEVEYAEEVADPYREMSGEEEYAQEDQEKAADY